MNRIDKKNVESYLDRIVASGKRALAVYPYGDIGKYAEEYLYKRHGIKIVFAVDNKNRDGSHVLSLDEIDTNRDILYLICSSNPKFYDEIRNRIYSIVDKDKVIDLFEYSEKNKWYKEYQNLSMRAALYDATYDNDDRIHRAKYTVAFWQNKYVHIDINDVFAGDVATAKDYPYRVYGIGDQEDIKALYYNGQFSEDEKDELLDAVYMGLICRNPGAHATAAYERIVKEGIKPSIDLVYKKLKEDDARETAFYCAEKIVLEGFRELIHRYAVEANKLYDETGKENLLEICNNCLTLMDEPPRNFMQGLQLILFIHLGIVVENGCGSFSFGRLDQYLYPLYKRDIDSGKLTQSKAQEFLNSFWAKLAEMDFGWQNITIGGERHGIDENNDLTIMCIKAAKEVGGQQPQLSLRIHNDTPDKVWDEALELLSQGMGFPAMFNDRVCKEAMRNKGLSDEDAENYSVMGCVELLSGGNEFSHQEGLRFNFVKFLELLLHKGKCSLTGKRWSLSRDIDLRSIGSAEELMVWYLDELRETIHRLCRLLDLTSSHYAKRYHAPFLSAMMDGPLKRGRDVHDNGTMYNNLTICGVGTGEVADCFQAIQQVCFEDNRICLTELVQILDGDFTGNEDIRQELLCCYKYGNDIDEVDEKCNRIAKVFTEAATGYDLQHRDGVMQVGFYTSYFHADFGKLTGASPDGRKRGMPLSPSLSPMAGMDQNGILATINSANRIDMSHFGNSMALDIKLSPVFFDKIENRDTLKTAIMTYFDRGGVEIQFNVIDSDTLKKAKENPMEYRNVIVRVAGFSARFVDLDSMLQDEIIRRTEHICA